MTPGLTAVQATGRGSPASVSSSLKWESHLLTARLTGLEAQVKLLYAWSSPWAAWPVGAGLPQEWSVPQLASKRSCRKSRGN